MAWYRLSSEKITLLVSATKGNLKKDFIICHNKDESHFSLEADRKLESVSLAISGVLESDLGLYYCALGVSAKTMHFGTAVRLTFADADVQRSSESVGCRTLSVCAWVVCGFSSLLCMCVVCYRQDLQKSPQSSLINGPPVTGRWHQSVIRSPGTLARLQNVPRTGDPGRRHHLTSLDSHPTGDQEVDLAPPQLSATWSIKKEFPSSLSVGRSISYHGTFHSVQHRNSKSLQSLLLASQALCSSSPGDRPSTVSAKRECCCSSRGGCNPSLEGYSRV
ncbi:uncharacterized protein LOC122340558 isoform X2 [Puntigrus tetrazona]|nr:uncharacterized protein LOC122340558 isoform X2 [Puntigrus tetrazona]